MNHEEKNNAHAHQHAHHEEAQGCCGGGCCDVECMEECNPRGATAAYIAQWILLGGAFVFSLLTFLMLPKMIKKAAMEAAITEPALKAGGVENYEKLNREIYSTQDYKDLMKKQVDLFIEQNKAQIELFKQQEADDAQPSQAMPAPEATTTSGAAATTGATATGAN